MPTRHLLPALVLLLSFVVLAMRPIDDLIVFTPKSATVKAMVDGKSWEGNEVKLAMQMAGQLHLEVMAADGTGIKLALFGANAPGTIQVGSGNMSIAAYLTPEKSYMSNVLTKPGKVEITELSSSGAKGSFEFYCGDDKTEIHVTQGSFSVEF